MNAISPQWFTDSHAATNGYDIICSDSNSKMRLKGKKLRERISDLKEEERYKWEKKSLFTTLRYYATSLFHYGI